MRVREAKGLVHSHTAVSGWAGIWVLVCLVSLPCSSDFSIAKSFWSRGTAQRCHPVNSNVQLDTQPLLWDQVTSEWRRAPWWLLLSPGVACGQAAEQAVKTFLIQRLLPLEMEIILYSEVISPSLLPSSSCIFLLSISRYIAALFPPNCW